MERLLAVFRNHGQSHAAIRRRWSEARAQTVTTGLRLQRRFRSLDAQHGEELRERLVRPTMLMLLAERQDVKYVQGSIAV